MSVDPDGIAVDVAMDFLGMLAGGAQINALTVLLIQRDVLAERRGYQRGVGEAIKACAEYASDVERGLGLTAEASLADPTCRAANKCVVIIGRLLPKE